MFCFDEMYIIPVPASQILYEHYEPWLFELSTYPELFLDVGSHRPDDFSFLLVSC